jgi:hypothetical protein
MNMDKLLIYVGIVAGATSRLEQGHKVEGVILWLIIGLDILNWYLRRRKAEQRRIAGRSDASNRMYTNA